MESQLKIMEGKIVAMDERLNARDQKLDHMLMILKKMEANSGEEKEGSFSSNGDKNQMQSRVLNFNPNVELPRFDGSDSRIWIKKACKYFSLYNIPDDQWVEIASLHMIDKAENWVKSYLSFKRYVDWHEFVLDLRAKFRDDNVYYVVEQFKKLEQKGSLESYIEEFEDLRSVLVHHNYYLPDSYILDCLIEGLKPSIKFFVKAFKPNGITQAIEYARLKEESLEEDLLKYSSKAEEGIREVPTLEQEFFEEQEDVIDSLDSITVTDIFEVPNVITYQSGQDGMTESIEDQYDPSKNSEDSDFCNFVQALTGSHNYQTMKVINLGGKKPIHILMGSRSTYGFWNSDAARHLDCMLEQVSTQTVAMADENKTICQYTCDHFTWDMQGRQFVTDGMFISPGSCDMVLRVQLKTLELFSWDFKEMIMKFEGEGAIFLLKGMLNERMRVVEENPAAKLCNNLIQFRFLQIFTREDEIISSMVKGCGNTREDDSSLEFEVLKKDYSMAFKDPSKLPLLRKVFDPGTPSSLKPTLDRTKKKKVI